jgi:hypothetical protein
MMNSSHESDKVKNQWTSEMIINDSNDRHGKHVVLDEQLAMINTETIKENSIDTSKNSKQQCQSITNELNRPCLDDDKRQCFRRFMRHACAADRHDWKYLAHCIYRLKHLIDNLDQYSLRVVLQQSFQVVFNEFVDLMKYVITTQIRSDEHTSKLSIHCGNLLTFEFPGNEILRQK